MFSLYEFDLKLGEFYPRAEWNSMEQDVVVLHVFHRSKQMVQPSPFCLKLETFLRANKIKESHRQL